VDVYSEDPKSHYAPVLSSRREEIHFVDVVVDKLFALVIVIGESAHKMLWAELR